MKKKTLKKLSLITIISLVILVASVSLAASWPINVNPPKDSKKGTPIEFGEGGEVTTVINLNDRNLTKGKVLVPEGKVVDSTKQTDEIIYTISLLWTEHEDSQGSSGDAPFIGELKYTYEISGVDESVKHLVKVEPNILADTIFFNEEKEVTLTITLTIPKDETEYELIKGKELIITLTIEVIDPKEYYLKVER